MDPISVAASILTLIAAASQTTKGLRSLYSLRHAPREIIELTNEVLKGYTSQQYGLSNCYIG
jgi:hypothetical protein